MKAQAKVLRKFRANLQIAIAEQRRRPKGLSTAAQVRLRNKQHGHLTTWMPAKTGTRNGKRYRYWNGGRGSFVMSWIEQTSERVFVARTLFRGTLGRYSNWWNAAECLDKQLLGQLTDL